MDKKTILIIMQSSKCSLAKNYTIRLHLKMENLRIEDDNRSRGAVSDIVFVDRARSFWPKGEEFEHIEV